MSTKSTESTPSIQAKPNAQKVERWGLFEIALEGPQTRNPFLDVRLSARFECDGHAFEPEGFYDGDGIYRVRCSPDVEGTWTFATRSNRPELDGATGSFECVAPSPGNHGPVRVRRTFHFEYADGTPYYPFGTTCYVWTHQGEKIEKQTLDTLAHAPFNKVRMCVFPKRYSWNENEPEFYPFEGAPPTDWDFGRFDPAFFRHFERRVGDLLALGIEADIILFHPYDKGYWGYDRMTRDTDDRYLRYLIARLAAYRNVWWSLANEFDLMRAKTMDDWHRFAGIVVEHDPYTRMRSIHNCRTFYDYTKPWVTHASVQNGSAVEDFGRAGLLREPYEKPIVYDEVKYEGNVAHRWGNLSAEEMVHRVWQGVIAGTYVTHGETYVHPDEVLWWAKGGVLHGQSPERIAFLRRIVEETAPDGLDPIDKWQNLRLAGQPGKYFLLYFGKECPTEWTFELPTKAMAGFEEGARFRVEVIDTWDMTIAPVEGLLEAEPQGMYIYACDRNPKVALPGKPYMALRIVPA
ncbi:DUF5060 domain-containing protein [Candidatus Sumerlaeota bacterium]|nr:DUF5060 domain-containing protein [Candidatus Sumerlaeota bacterium]